MEVNQLNINIEIIKYTWVTELTMDKIYDTDMGNRTDLRISKHTMYLN